MTDSIRIGQPPQAASPPPVPPRRRRWPLIAGAVAAVVVVAGAAAAIAVMLARPDSPGTDAKASPPATFSVYVTMMLTGGQYRYIAGEGCAGRGGYDDIEEGAQVVVTDAAGTTVAVGRLGTSFYDDSRARCTFPIIINGVPDGGQFYAIEVSHRGKVQYARADLNQTVTLSIG